MFEYIEDKYKSNLSDLIKKIRDEKCCAFIGAGFSTDAKYPSWMELLEIIKKRAKDVNGNEIDDDNRDNYDRAANYKEILGEDLFYSIIAEEFNPDNDKQPYLAVHLSLIELPFKSYITTNYDCLLENASVKLNNRLNYSFYPTLPITRLREREIYHIHGIIDHERLEDTIRSIRLTKQDIEEAYHRDSSVISLFKSLYSELSMFITGFNINEINFQRIINECKVNFQRTAGIYSNQGRGSLPDRVHYALLPYPYLQEHDEKVTHKNHDASTEIDLEQTSVEDDDLKQLGINVIRYKGSSKDHSKSRKLIDELNQFINNIEQKKCTEDPTFRIN